MFEQSLYNVETPVEPTHEGDLFHNYEIKSWEFGPRIYKILAAAGAANLLALLVFAQTSLLTMKGCDSPLVGRVCQVLDVVYVGSALFGTDREYVDAVYEKTELGDNEEITFVDVTGVTPPLSYPEGYFQIANPVEYQMALAAQNAAMFPNDYSGFSSGVTQTFPSTGSSIIDTPPNTPKANPNVVQGELPTFGGSSGGSTSRPSNRRSSRPAKAKPAGEDVDDNEAVAVVEATPTPEATPEITSDSVTSVEINKKPLTDFADSVVAKWETNEVDLNQPFMIVLNGVITPDGKLDRQKSKFDVSKQKGDPKMIDVAKAAIEAVGDSGFLTYLKNLNVDKITVTLLQDDKQITALISSGQTTPERAKQVSSGLGLMMTFGKATVKNPSDERTLLDGAKVTAEGKNFVLNFTMPKPVAHEMITRKLKEAQAKKLQQPQPNGSSTVKSGDQSANK